VSNTCRLHVESLWISPYVFSSFVALKEKRIDFDVEVVSLFDRAHLSPHYGDLSLTGRVPCLEHEGFALSESSAIAEYLEERFPLPAHARLLPLDLRDRARARQLMAWLRSDLLALREERSTITMFYRFELEPLSPAGERDTAKLLRVADALVPADAFALFGDWSLVDSELAFMLQRLLLNGHELPSRISTYVERQWQRPTVQAFVNQPRPVEVPAKYWTHAGMACPKAKPK
jgi:glutathione S-transferase